MTIQRTIVLIPLIVIGVVVYLFVQNGPQTALVAPPTPMIASPESPLATPQAIVSPLVAPTNATEPLTVSTSSSPSTVASVALSATTPYTGTPRTYGYEVVAVYPHDPNAFTQGLLFDEGVLYEGTGLYGESTLRRVDLATGQVEQQSAVAAQFFGEGITIVGNRLYQLTWREGRGFIYDKTTFALEAEFTYPTEGWGLTDDGQTLLMSDGSAQIFRLDPTTLELLSTINVQDEQGPVMRLNELEYINGVIYANIWQTDRIAQIDPATGQVIGWIDLTGLLPDADRTNSTDVLNGIAYLPTEDRLFVTGKKWPKLFEIRLIAQN